MANTGNTQQQINYGASANDGQGDPLRTAFIKTDDNFDAIWNTGPVGSNITILNNTVQSNNTNGNIVLRPNGVGVIQANAAIIPNATNLRDLGSANQRFRAAYVGTGGLSVDGNVTVTGNLTAGNISYTGNVFVGDLQGSVYADDSTIMVDAVDNEMFASAVTFGRANVSGNVSAAYFIGNGSLLTGITSYGNANVAAYLPTYTGDIGPVNNTGNLAIGNIQVLANIRPVTGNTGSVGTFGNPWAFAHIDTIYTNNLEPISGNVQVPGNLEASTVVTGQIENIFPLFITTNGGGTWEFAGNILRGPQGGSWSSDANTSYFNSPANGFLNLTSLQNDSVVSELFMEHSFIRFLVDNGGPSKIWLMRLDGTFAVPGDILPPANITASLGNTTNYWSTLQVANINHEFPMGIQTNGGGVWEFAGNTLRGPQGGSWSSDAATSYFNSPANGFLNLSSLQSGNVVSELFMEHSFIRFFIDNGIDATWEMKADGRTEFPGYTFPYADGNAGEVLKTDGSGNLAWATDSSDYGNANVATFLAAFGSNTISTTGNVTANYFLGNGSLLTGVASTGNITFTDTTVSPPDGVDITISAANSEVIIEAFDIRLDATDDLRLTGNDIVSLRNRSTTDPVTIITDYDNTETTWTFAVDGTLTTPGDIVVAGDVTGTAGANTLVLKAQPASNTSIQLNSIVDSVISTVADLEIRTDVSNTARTFEFGADGRLILPESSEANVAKFTSPPNDANVSLQLYSGNAVRIVTNTTGEPFVWTFGTTGTFTAAGNISGGNIITAGRVLASGNILGLNFGTEGSVQASSVEATGNISGGNLIATNGVYANIDFVAGDRANASAIKTRIVSDTDFSYIQTGNGTVGSTGNIVFSPYSDPTQRVVIDTSTGNLTAGNVLTDNVIGESANVELVAGDYTWTFDNTGNTAIANGTVTANNLTLTGNITGNVDGYNIGYREIPQVTLSANANAALSDSGKHFYSTTAGNLSILIPTNANVAFPVGSAFTVVVQAAGNVLVNADSGVNLYLAGNSTAGNRVVSTYGMATVIKVASDTWFINGTGVA